MNIGSSRTVYTSVTLHPVSTHAVIALLRGNMLITTLNKFPYFSNTKIYMHYRALMAL